MKLRLKILLLILLAILLNACSHAHPKTSPFQRPSETYVPVKPADVEFGDDLDTASLDLAIERSIKYYDSTGRNKVYRVEGRSVDSKQLRETLTAFRAILRETGNGPQLTKKITEKFNVYRIAGPYDSGSTLFTGYYEPLLEGSRRPSDKYKYPLYRVPADLVKNQGSIGRMKDGKFMPYYSRYEIDVEGALRDRNLELVWVSDPLELFSLHVQGSGKVRLEDGTLLTVGFAQTNGRPFRSVTKFMIENGKIQASEATYRYAFLKGKSDREIYDILSYNERYTFFRFLDREPVGSLGQPVTPRRTIATDPDFFPEGALAFIRLRKPVFDDQGNVKEWVNFSRFVLSQDKGVAIAGPGRVDIFCGFGIDAENTAGSLKENGELYLLLKK